MKFYFSIISFLSCGTIFSQTKHDSIFFFTIGTDVKVTIDYPLQSNLSAQRQTIIIIYALPNGNSTEQTMGKKIKENDDWHFDIQHIRAQTRFIRRQLSNKTIIVAYLENDLKSWPQWKTSHQNYILLVQHIVDTVFNLFRSKNKELYLNGHSGGGRFILSYLDGIDQIPSYVRRITFLDSNYGYDSTYLPKLSGWLLNNKDAHLNVFAYNDSVALYNDKPVVSPTGGTWYRSHKMLRDLSKDFIFKKLRDDSLIIYHSSDKRIQFFFKTNPERKIYHTKQVELNGFIHSVLSGTRNDSRRYKYYNKRAYSDLIE